MIRHILLVRAPDDSDAEIATLFSGIAALRLPGLLAVSSGPSRSPEDLERGYTHGLVADFADWDALRGYAEDPEHRAIGSRLTMVAEGGIDGLLVVDLELP